jgi:hypothetical protein
MRRLHLAISSVVALGVIVAISIRTRPLTPAELERRLAEYAKQGRLAQYDLPSFLVGDQGKEQVEALYIKACVEQAREKYGRNVNGFAINSPTFDPNLVNLVFFKEDPEDTFRGFHDNCAFTGYKNIIVCDLTFLHEITGTTRKDLELESRNPTGQPHPLLKVASVGIALWVIGHEIGHLAHGHQMRHFLFQGEAARNLIRNPDGHPVGNSLTVEQEADSFAYDVFKDRTPQLGSALTLGLLQVEAGFRNEQRSRQGDVHGEVFGPTYHHYRPEIPSETHPPTFLRAVTITKYISERPFGQTTTIREK